MHGTRSLRRLAAVLALAALLTACGEADSSRRPFNILTLPTGVPTSVAFSPDGATLAAGARLYVKSTNTWAAAVYLWRAATWSALPTLNLGEAVPDGRVGVAFSPDGALLAAAEPSGVVHVWQTADWQARRELAIDPGLSGLVAFSPDGATLAATTGGGTVRLWRVADWTPLPPLTIAAPGADAMAFAPDSRALATGGSGEEVQIWRLADGQQLQRLRGHTKGITSLAFAPDGQSIASGSYDNTMRLWRVSDGSVLDTWDITPTALLFTAGGANILESDLWRDPTLFRVKDGAVILRLGGDPAWDAMSPKGLSLALSPDGQILAGGAGHGDIWLWRLP
jgi:WD40 repeat protein